MFGTVSPVGENVVDPISNREAGMYASHSFLLSLFCFRCSLLSRLIISYLKYFESVCILFEFFQFFVNIGTIVWAKLVDYQVQSGESAIGDVSRVWVKPQKQVICNVYHQTVFGN